MFLFTIYIALPSVGNCTLGLLLIVVIWLCLGLCHIFICVCDISGMVSVVFKCNVCDMKQ